MVSIKHEYNSKVQLNHNTGKEALAECEINTSSQIELERTRLPAWLVLPQSKGVKTLGVEASIMSEYDHCLITFLRGHNGSTETFINATTTQKGLNSDQFNWTSEKIRPPHRSDTYSLETYSCSLYLAQGCP